MRDLKLTAEQRACLQSKLKRNVNVRAYRRAVALLAVDKGRSVEQVAGLLGVSRQSIYKWVTTYAQDGQVTDLCDAPRSGRPSVWAEDDDAFLLGALRQAPGDFGYTESHWNASLLRQCLSERRGKDLSSTTLRRKLGEMNYVWRRGRYVMLQASRSERAMPDRFAPPIALPFAGSVSTSGSQFDDPLGTAARTAAVA